MLTSIPAYQTVPKIAMRLGLEEALVQGALQELTALELVAFERGRWIASGRDLHLPRDSPLTAVNHCNWRHRAITKIQSSGSAGLHYTGIHALSRRDIEQFTELLRDTIFKTRQLVAPSPEEDLICFTCDLFQI